MPPTATTRNRLLLILLWVIFYASFTLFLPPLLDDADSVHAEVAREMIQRHDWVTLYANGIRYLEKAPILYWSMAASFKLFGVSTAAARLPIALTVLALALFLEAFARRAFANPRAGLYAGLITLSSFGIFIFTRITIPDADVCLWLTLALLAFWTTEQSPLQSAKETVILSEGVRALANPAVEGPAFVASQNPGAPHLASEMWDSPTNQPIPGLPCFLFAAACALNVLTKGLIGIVFPIAIVLLYLLITRGPRGTLRRLNQLHPWTSLLVFFALAAPWHILIGLANPTQGHPAPISHLNGLWQVPLPTDGNVHGWFWFYFVNEHLLRYLNLRVPRDYDTVPLALFWGLILIWLMPWSAYLVHAIARVPLWKALRQIPWVTTKIEPTVLFSTRKEAVILSEGDRAFASPAVEGSRRGPLADEFDTIPPTKAGAPHLDSEMWDRTATAPTGQALSPLQKTNLLLGLWAATPLLFFSLSTRQEYYVLPALPALILLIAAYLAEDSKVAIVLSQAPGDRKGGPLSSETLAALSAENSQVKAVRGPFHVRVEGGSRLVSHLLLALGTVVSITLCFFLLHTAKPAPTTDLATLLQQNPGDYALSMGHFLDLNAQALGLFRLPLTLTAAALFLGTLANWLLRRAERPHAANLSLASATFVFLLAAHLGLQTFSPVLSSERLAAAIAPQLRPGDLIVLHGEYEAGSTLGFYLRRNDLHLCEGRSSNLWYGSFFPDAPKIFETRESITEKWSGTQRIFLWQDPSDKDRPILPLTPTYVIATSGGKQILSNQPNR
jgi:4-amino-4-deoxy-L-arabinose transferase-like glycosyltransferase